jgi:hypothetical protein
MELPSQRGAASMLGYAVQPAHTAKRSANQRGLFSSADFFLDTPGYASTPPVGLFDASYAGLGVCVPRVTLA